MWLHSWPVPDNVGLAFTDRFGGVSQAPFASLNLGAHVGDDFTLVTQNRQLLSELLNLPAAPIWLNQVHGTRVLRNPSVSLKVEDADGCYSNQAHQVCTVMTADCLPVVICDQAGTQVCAVHAGWRGLCDGIIEQAVALFTGSTNDLIAYLGPAIGPHQFEVGAEVKAAFVNQHVEAQHCFIEHNGKYLANIYQLAQQRLAAVNVTRVYSSNECTVSNPQFFSYRRDKHTGRQATLVWLKS